MSNFTPNINQFAQSAVVGQMDLEFNGSVVSAAVSANQVTALIAGQPVAVENSFGGVPRVVSLAAANSDVSGFVARNLKDATFPAQSRIELAMKNSVMFMQASGAIVRFAPVEIDFSTIGQVKPSGGVNPIVGFAFDEAVNAGDLIRVYIDVPTVGGATTVRTANITATLAQINAGLVLIPGKAGKAITVTSYVARVTGGFATGTSVELESDSTSVAVTTIAEAGLTNGAVLTPNSANTTLGAGFGSALPTAEGLKLVNNGSAQTGGTSIQFTLSYTQG